MTPEAESRPILWFAFNQRESTFGHDADPRHSHKSFTAEDAFGSDMRLMHGLGWFYVLAMVSLVWSRLPYTVVSLQTSRCS